MIVTKCYDLNENPQNLFVFKFDINMNVINIKNISFGNYIRNTIKDGFSVENEYSDNNKLLNEVFYNNDETKALRKKINYDKTTGKILKVENFDKDGLWLDSQEFEYLTDKEIEKFDSKAIKYVRTITKQITDSVQNITELYESPTNPSNNYLYEIKKDLKGKMLSFICNGEKVL